MVPGFTREMFYDLKPEEEDEEPIPGLYRYLTLWSAGPVNLNTAEYPVLASVKASDLVEGWGTFDRDEMSLTTISENSGKAVRLVEAVGFDD